VVATLEPGIDPMHFDQPWKVRWEPTAGGIYPAFAVVLAVRADEDYDDSMLELAGDRIEQQYETEESSKPVANGATADDR
jgi:hypothetical protein